MIKKNVYDSIGGHASSSVVLGPEFGSRSEFVYEPFGYCFPVVADAVVATFGHAYVVLFHDNGCLNVFFCHGNVMIVSIVVEELNLFYVRIELQSSRHGVFSLVNGAAKLVEDVGEAHQPSELRMLDNYIPYEVNSLN